MKKKVMLGVIAAMVVSMSATVFAGPSIGQIIPEEPQIVSTNVPEGAKLVVSTIDVTDEKTLDNYTSNETVKTLLKTVNDEETKPTIETVKEVLKEMNVEDVTNVETKSGEKVDLTEYKFTTPFIDIAEQIGDQITYKTNGDLEVKVKIDAAKEKKAEDLLLMLVDPETGKVVFITIDEIDPVTGELKVTLPFLGAITLLDKSAVDENEIKTQTTDAGAADTETAAE